MAEQAPAMWLDLTVAEAEKVRDFYQQVAGFQAEPLGMGGYDDYVLKDPVNGTAVGVCHARGPNAELPPVWLPYFFVADLDASMAAVARAGGEVRGQVRKMGETSRYVLVRDPAGAHCMLYQK